MVTQTETASQWFRIGHRVGNLYLRPQFCRVAHNQHYLELCDDGRWRRTRNTTSTVADLFWNCRSQLADEAEAIGSADEAEALRNTRRLRRQLANPSSALWCGIRAAILREAKPRRNGSYRLLDHAHATEQTTC